MQTKQIRVLISFPYQIANYMYGKVEMEEIIEVSEKDTPQLIEAITAERLSVLCKEQAIKIISGMEQGIKEEVESQSIDKEHISVRKRRF